MVDYQDPKNEKTIVFKKPVDTENHQITKTRTGKTLETSVWEFNNLRKARLSRYNGFYGLNWALADLADKTRRAIRKKDIPGRPPEEGDIIQACVVCYYLDNIKHEAETTPDSPLYATLPYKIVRGVERNITTELAIPKEMAIHLTIPQIIGDLIPTLTPEQRQQVIVTLQLKESTHESIEKLVEEVVQSQRSPELTYKLSPMVDKEVAEFQAIFGVEEQRPIKNDEWEDFTKSLRDTAVIPKQEYEVEGEFTVKDLDNKFSPEEEKTPVINERLPEETPEEVQRRLKARLRKIDENVFGIDFGK